MTAQYASRTGRLSVWESDRDTEFNHSKCQVVQVTDSRIPINAAYRLHCLTLETVTCARYLRYLQEPVMELTHRHDYRHCPLKLSAL